MRSSEQGTTLFSAACAFIMIVVGLQLWLVSASVEALLSGELDVLGPAAAASVILALASGGILLHALDLDRRRRKGGIP